MPIGVSRALRQKPIFRRVEGAALVSDQKIWNTAQRMPPRRNALRKIIRISLKYRKDQSGADGKEKPCKQDRRHGKNAFSQCRSRGFAVVQVGEDAAGHRRGQTADGQHGAEAEPLFQTGIDIEKEETRAENAHGQQGEEAFGVGRKGQGFKNRKQQLGEDGSRPAEEKGLGCFL